MKPKNSVTIDQDIALKEQKVQRSHCKSSNEKSISVFIESKCSATQFCVFGTCLDHLMTSSSQTSVPYIVSRLCKFIENYGLSQQSLFQEPEGGCVVQGLKKEFNEFGDASLELSGDAPAASILLKLFFEELPEPLIPASMQSDFVDNMKEYMVNSDDCVKHFKFLVSQLPVSAFCVLKYLSHFLLTVANHGDTNGLSCANLGIIFGPIIFRPARSDPTICIMIRNITHCFVADYYSIFEESIVNNPEYVSSLMQERQCSTKVTLEPSSIMPGNPMMPLRVFIPSADDLTNLSGDDQHTPILLIEHSERSDKITNWKVPTYELAVKAGNGFCLPVRRKRKEDLSEIVALTPDLANNVFHSLQSYLKIKGSHKGKGFEVHHENQGFYNFPAKTVNTNNNSLGKNGLYPQEHSPHPPDPKRRETDSMGKLMNQESNSLAANVQVLNTEDLKMIKQEEPIGSYFKFLSDPVWENSFKPMFPSLHRSSSCMNSGDDDNDNFEVENRPVMHGWNALFESEEPVRSQRNFSCTIPKENEEIPDNPASQNYQNFSEAPLSPSAYRSYLTHQSSYLDSSIPPTPPTKQECFENSLPKDDNFVKQLTKRIHALKKKIWRFEEKYENEYGYKPSHAEKAKFSEGKKLLSELHKARKELKALKEEMSTLDGSCTMGGISSSVHDAHILEDTTNCIKHAVNRSTHSVQDSFGGAIKSFHPEIKPEKAESFEDVTCDARAKTFSTKEMSMNTKNISCKLPVTVNDHLIRPICDQYRNAKHILVRSSSFPVYVSKNNNCNALQPIMEHEAMDFTSLQNEKKRDECCAHHRRLVVDTDNAKVDSDTTPDSFSLDMKYNNSSLHELPLSEMICQRHFARTEKKRLRKILREFEAEFLKINGRKVQKDDKAAVDSLYSEYKLAKARLRLLEALISKHHEHIFI